LRWIGRRVDASSAWLRRVLARKPVNVAVTAYPRKIARIAWAMFRRNEPYRSALVAADGEYGAEACAGERKADGLTRSESLYPAREQRAPSALTCKAIDLRNPSGPAVCIDSDARPDTCSRSINSEHHGSNNLWHNGGRPYTLVNILRPNSLLIVITKPTAFVSLNAL
jgi:hypothetical protein